MRQITGIGKGPAEWALGSALTLPKGYSLDLGDPQLGVHPYSTFVPGMVADVCMMECTICCLLDGDDGAWFKEQVERLGGRWKYSPEGFLPLPEIPKTAKREYQLPWWLDWGRIARYLFGVLAGLFILATIAMALWKFVKWAWS